MGVVLARLTALGLGLAVLAWQVVNARHGRLVHEFLLADLVCGVGLLASSTLGLGRIAQVAMLAGYSALGGVFLTATTMRALLGGYDFGTFLTTLGLGLCAAWVVILGRGLANEVETDDHQRA